MCQVYQGPLTIIVDASVKKKNTPALNICTLAEFLCVSPNIMAKANGFFQSFFWGGSFSFCLWCHSAWPPSCAPSTPVSTAGHLPGSAVWAWRRLALWWQVAAGQRACHLKKRETECTPNVAKKAALTNIMVSIHHKRELPAKCQIFFGLSKHFTGSVFNTKPVIKGVQTAWGWKVEKENRGSFGCFPDTWVWPEVPPTFVLGLHLVQTSVWEELKQLDQDSTQLLKHLNDIVKL